MPYKIPNDPYQIYLIESEWEWYVGKTFGKTMGTARRFEVHMTNPGQSGARRLSLAVAEHGRDAFSWTILESGVGDHIAAERSWYDLGKIFEGRVCLNGGRPSFGGNRSEDITPEWRQAMSDAKRGKPRSPEAVAASAAGHRGLPCPETTKAAVSAALKGKPKTPEHIEKLAAAHRGKPLSAEHKKKMSDAMKRKPHDHLTVQVSCADCEVVNNPGVMGRHFKRTGHHKQA